MARIEAALERIEAAMRQRPSGPSDSAELADLQARHAQLRAAVTSSLSELDQLIEGAQA